MAAQGFLLIATFLLVLMVLARPLGSGLARLINDIPLPGTAGVERILFRLPGVSDHEMNWKQYLCAILGLNMLGLAVLFFMLLGQHYLPLNPQQLPGLSWDLALNTAVSFVTNTNWQSYSGETTLSYFSQMAGLTVQNFLSAASGIAVIFAFIRAFTRQSMSTLGNAWVDLLRITLWVLVPVALLIALFFIQQGALQNFLPYQAVNTVEGAQQLLPMGPVASQEAIKMLGTNGGGFFNANSSHPFENPTALTNFVQMLAIFLIPTALCFAFGEVTGDRRQGRMLQWAMSVIFVICVGVVMWAEVQGNPHLLALGADSSINMEGKESRFGVLVSSLFAVVTTAASCGAVIAMHDSFTALGGMVPMWLMQIGEVVFGGVGSGLYGMMLFVLLAVFIAGLMIGRTPEYLGKKIDVREMKLTALGQWWFPWQANGSLIREGDTVRGSALIGQNFTGNGYFHGRPSATAEMPYNPQASGGSNLAVSNPELDKLIAARVAALRAANPDASASIPVELVTASASGLDNNITPQAAAWQIPRIAKARNLSVEQLTQLIAKYSQQPLVKYIGQPVVNIVELNLALDKLDE
ncbi:potassium-transporting ATPase subunit A [Shigella sonnei]